MSDGTVVIVLRALNAAMSPLAADLATPASALRMLRSLGLNLQQPLQSVMQLAPKVQVLVQRMARLDAALTAAGGDETSPQVASAIADVGRAAADLFTAFKALATQVENDLAAFPEVLAQFDPAVFARRLVDYLAISYLRDLLPQLYNLLAIFGIVEVEAREASGDAVPPHVSYSLRLDRLTRIPKELPAVLGEVYGWGTAGFDARLLLERIQYLAMSLGYAPPLLDTGDFTQDRGTPELRLSLYSSLGESGAVDVGLALAPLASATPPGLALRPYSTGMARVNVELRPRLTLALEGSFDATGGLSLELTPPFEPAFRVGPAAGGALAAGAGLGVQWGRESGERVVVLNLSNLLLIDFDGLLGKVLLRTGSSSVLDVQLGVVDGALSLQTTEADGFLARILPQGGVRAPFDLGVGWNSATGVYFLGSGGFEVTLPIGLRLGPIAIAELTVALRIGSSDVTLDAGVTANGVIGPVSVAIENVGVSMLLEFKSGNIGPAHFTAHFKWPTAVGVAVDAGPIAGGGFIAFDHEMGRYSGTLQLRVLGVAVKVIGLVETKLPDGRPGYSFLLIITTEFAPIQLGYGFTLNGVGGLAGINRTIQADALRAGVYGGSLDHILFPVDPVRNAPQLISDLTLIFPPAEGQYAFGPMAKLGWGTPTLIEISLGIIIELPSPVRIALLGQIGMFLPKKEVAIVEIHVDFVAMIDFGAKLLSLDATLRDSRIVAFTLTGDMALRLAWGEQPNFAVALGGFNPHFPTPPGFPALRRLTLALGAGDTVRITCQAYQALTTNSLQFGARADLWVDVGVTVRGWIGFDALFIFSPFEFQVDFTAGLEVAAGGIKLAGVSFDGTLYGPTPWRIRGEATLSVLFFEITARVDKRFGEERREVLPPVDPWRELQRALTDARQWSATALPGTAAVVTMAPPSGAIAVTLLDPSGRTTWRQRVLPLNHTITRLGNSPTTTPVKYAVDRVRVQSTDSGFAAVTDFFAGAQYNDWTDAEKLSRPSFEPMEAGVAIGDALAMGPALGTEIDYETRLIDSQFESRRGARFKFTRAAQLVLADHAGAWRGGTVRAGLRAFGSESQLDQGDERFVVVSTRDLSRHATLGAAISKTAATQGLAAYLRGRPAAEHDQWQVVPEHELEAA
jgi:hypothetical protein